MQFKKYSKRVWVTALVMVGIFVVATVGYFLAQPNAEQESSGGSENATERACDVVGINLHGEIVTYIPPQDPENGQLVDQTSADDVMSSIYDAKNNTNIKAIILEVDSGGGSAVASEEIANALASVKNKTTVALIRDRGDSGGYLAATGASIIFASANSEIGNIGVNASYLDNSEKNRKEGLVYRQLTTGKYKDMGNPDKSLTKDEQALWMRDLNIMHKNFVALVSENRKLSSEKVAALADGSTMLGEMAIKRGLVDKIGGLQEVHEYLRGVIGAEPVVCWE